MQSSFHPLNQLEDPTASKTEHTRELQVEKAFKVFDEALTCQKNKQFDQCFRLYEQLFKLTVISGHYDDEQSFIRGIQNGSSNTIADELSFLSTNLKSLRFLIFRNRAFFYLDLLKAGVPLLPIKYPSGEGDDVPSEFEAKKETFYTMLDDMGNALIYQEADTVLVQTLSEILLFMRARKLARFVLEYAVASRRESEDIMGLIPLDPATLKRYKVLVDQIENSVTDEDIQLEDIDKTYDFLTQFKDDHLTQVLECEQPKVNTCRIKTKGEALKWEHVTGAINQMVKSLEDKPRIETTSRSKLRDIDPYFFTTTSVDILRIEMPNEEEEEDEEQAPVIVEQEPETVVVDETTMGEEQFEDAMDLDETPAQPDIQTGDIEKTTTENGDTEAVEKEAVDTEAEKDTAVNTEVEKEAVDTDVEKDAPTEAKDDDVIITKVNSYGSPAPSTPTSQSKQIQRASKRLQKNELEALSWYPSIPVTPEMFSETTEFFKEINKFFSKLNLEKPDVLDDIASKFADPSAEDVYVSDFVNLLSSYDPSVHFKGFSEALRIKRARTSNDSDKETQKIKLLEVLKSFSSSRKTKPSPGDTMDVITSDTLLVDFLTEINAKHCHLNDVKILLLRRLLGNQANNTCYICDLEWSNQLLNDVRTWVIQLEEQMMQESTGVLSKNIESEILNELTLSTSVFELLVDTYIEQKTKVDSAISQNVKKGFQKALKASINVQISSISKVRNIIERWKAHIGRIFFKVGDSLMDSDLGFKCYVRFQWAVAYKERADNANFTLSKFIANHLSQLYQLISSQHKDTNIPMPNYQHITEIDLKSINLLSNTITVLTMFAKILYSDDKNANENDNEEATTILERTLVDPRFFTADQQNNLDESAISSVKSLLSQSNPEMKFNLWTILFQYYNNMSDLSRFQFGFERVVETILQDLTSSSYTSMGIVDRELFLLHVLSLFDEYLFYFVNCLSKNSWKLPNVQNSQTLQQTFLSLTQLFQLFYMFSLHEEAALITSKKTSLKEMCGIGYDRFKGSLTKVAAVMGIYYDVLLSSTQELPTNKVNDTTLDLLSVMHEQLGLRRLCDSGEGIFLQMFQDVLLESDFSNRRKDALQILYCRNHCNITSGGFTPTDHGTTAAIALDKESVYNISKLVHPLCLNKEPLVNPPRGDLKSILDQFYEVIGDPDLESNPVLEDNTKIFTEFLNRTIITPTFIKECFYGLQKVNLFPVEDNEMTRIIQGGLYYLQGIVILSSFKARRAAGSGKSLEVEHVSKLLQNDLLYGSNRVESWLLLGQAYGYLAEDDLLWTPDKLSIPEKKAATANVQRKALICYLMAINYSRGASDTSVSTIKLAIPELTASFSREMFNACMIPMEMMAFKTTDVVRFIHKDKENKLVNTSDRPSLKRPFAFKIIQQCLHLAIKSNPKDCMNYYLLSKVQGKLGIDYSIVVDTLLTACELSHRPSTTTGSDIIIEPHYRLCSVLYKAVKTDKFAISEAIKILSTNVIFKGAPSVDPETTDKKGFYHYVVDCLKRIQPFDKKKWQHKYHYRISKIYVDDLNNVKEAIEEMSVLVSSKVTSKSLVQFWKPDNERPGKHFYYTFQYVSFYIDLLYKDKNLHALTSIFPRLRKSMSLMLSLNVAWERLCSSICKLTRHLYDVKENFTESFLNTPINLFFRHSDTINNKLKGKPIPERLQPTLVLLNILTEIKKANSGFGPTSLIDDTIVALFINIYYVIPSDDSEQGSSAVNNSPSGKPKRLAKKDIFPCANDILKNSKREIDTLMKERPNILTEFVDQKEKERKDVASNQPQNSNPSQASVSKTPELSPIPEPSTPVPESPTPAPQEPIHVVTATPTPAPQINQAPAESIDLTQTPKRDNSRNHPIIIEPVSPQVIIDVDKEDSSNKRVIINVEDEPEEPQANQRASKRLRVPRS